ncbi:MAG: chromosome segregation protein SMC, partial [Gammaproteobacteria bacterium]
MRLSKIKLAGFKSFVDPTPIHFPSNLVGIVGPNGCGKSNVIDAIRWVMGESSAKHLRGDSMADVIFNGSSSRKPVGTASVELYFDNSDGTVGGQYADYAEICIRRAVERDGTSQYFLNNVRCRRKDITGIFLGTGLGPRSYAIIEQGMISRLIEAKPEEMRVYIEEAAGISKYKARRRETENRIRHTRDNLDRLNDLREEVEKQIKHLQRQKRQAERYKELKQEERTLEAELLAIRLGSLQQDQEGQEQRLSQGQTALEAAVAGQRGVEAEIETAREAQIEQTEAFNEAQGKVWAVQSEISRLEQALAHARETRDRQSEDLQVAQSQLEKISEEINEDRAQLEELESSLERLAPDLEQARETEQASVTALRQVEAALEDWQKTWHDFTLETKEHQRVGHVETTRIEQLDARLVRLRARDAELSTEQQGISIDQAEAALLTHTRGEQDARQTVERLGRNLEETDREITQLREHEQTCSGQLEAVRGELESDRGRVETLEALQEAAFGDDVDDVRRWVAAEDLGARPRLAQRLQVEKPWEVAVETVLGDFLQAICVTRCEDHLARLPSADVLMINERADRFDAPGTLLEKVQNAGSAGALLSTVRVANSLNQALALQQRLAPGQTVITADGVWLGSGWVRVSRGQQEAGGLISREQDIRALREQVRDAEQRVVRFEKDRTQTRERLAALESQRTETSRSFTDANRRFGEAESVLASLRQDFDRTKERVAALTRDEQSVRDEITAMQDATREARAKQEHATAAQERLEQRRPELERQREQLQAEFERARDAAGSDQANAARINVEFESRRASKESASSTLTRISAQRSQLHERVTKLNESVEHGETPIRELQDHLDAELQREVGVKRDLEEQRRKMEVADSELRSSEVNRSECETKVTEAREAVDNLRMHVREIQVRREGVAEQFAQLGVDLAATVAALDEAADVDQWDERLTTVRRRIDRLGAINLAAIEEFDEQSERQKYLEAQFEDLTSALETLEGAIRKIDRETRTRFKETFDSVNAGISRLFPKLFGGGHAYL